MGADAKRAALLMALAEGEDDRPTHDWSNVVTVRRVARPSAPVMR